MEKSLSTHTRSLTFSPRKTVQRPSSYLSFLIGISNPIQPPGVIPEENGGTGGLGEDCYGNGQRASGGDRQVGPKAGGENAEGNLGNIEVLEIINMI